MLAQGIGNLASSLWSGIPVGASLGDTNMSVQSGARSRFAAVAGGIWMGVILAAFSGAVGLVALPTLSAVLIFFGLRSFQPGQAQRHLAHRADIAGGHHHHADSHAAAPGGRRRGHRRRGLAAPPAQSRCYGPAGGRTHPARGRRAAEAPPPHKLPSHHVTILNVYGSLLYAGSRTLQAKLPDPSAAESAALILRLRKRTSLGATFIKVISDYAGHVAAGGGRVYLSGLEADVIERLRKAGLLGEHVQATEATPILGESTRAAYVDAESFLLKGGPVEE